jgi:hypothetical protein
MFSINIIYTAIKGIVASGIISMGLNKIIIETTTDDTIKYIKDRHMILCALKAISFKHIFNEHFSPFNSLR